MKMHLKCNLLTCQTFCGRIPQRVVLAIMLHLALQISYNLRMCLNVAIVEMVEPPKEINRTEQACPQFESIKKKREGGEFPWPRMTESLVLYSFYIGYVVSQVPGGWLADKFGGRYVLGICILLSSLSTVIFPYFTQISGYITAVILRGILGLAQGPVLPTISSFVSTWIPQNERTLLGGISYGGSNLGTILGSIITGYLIHHFNGWPMAFYFWSGFSSFYIILHLLYLFSFPSTHPFIQEEEKDYLNKVIVTKRKLKTPWKAILTNVPYWANISAQFGHNWIFFTLVTYLPTYMKEILQFDIAQNGLYSALPFCALWISSLILSCTGSYLVHELHCMSGLTFTKFFGTFSNMLSAALALAAVYAGCNRALCIFFYILCMIVKAFYYMTLPVNINELSRNHGGTMFGICNGICSLSGIIGNAMIGAVTKDKKLVQWKYAFWITFAVSVATSVVFILYASTERQAFDYDEEDEPPPQ